MVLSYIIIGQYPTQLLASCVSIFLCLKPPVQSRFGLAHPHRDPLASPLLVTLLSLPPHPHSSQQLEKWKDPHDLGSILPVSALQWQGTGLLLSLIYFCTHSSTGAPQLWTLSWDRQTRGIRRDEGGCYWRMMVKASDFEAARDAPPLLWGVLLSNSLSNGVRAWLLG